MYPDDHIPYDQPFTTRCRRDNRRIKGCDVPTTIMYTLEDGNSLTSDG